MIKPIYLDNNATTPLDKRVFDKMLPYFYEEYGNPSSVDHYYGLEAKKAIDSSREIISSLIGSKRSSEIIFTGGATESNNLALIGAFRKYKKKGNHIICSSIEHSSVLNTLKYLEKEEGAKLTILEVDEYGSIDLDDLRSKIIPETIIISVMFANNEIGTIQPVCKIGQMAKENDIIFHCDAAQAVGYEKIDVYEMNIDLLSFSSHKFFGPKGVGGLFVRSQNPMVRLSPLIHGGGQEKGLRSGTMNVPSIVGMAEALKLSQVSLESNKKKIINIRKGIVESLQKHFSLIKINGHPVKRINHNISITIPGVESKLLIQKLKDRLSFSTGSACASVKVVPSHVLKAIGLSDDECYQTIRIGLGRVFEKYDLVAKILVDAINSILSF